MQPYSGESTPGPGRALEIVLNETGILFDNEVIEANMFAGNTRQFLENNNGFKTDYFKNQPLHTIPQLYESTK